MLARGGAVASATTLEQPFAWAGDGCYPALVHMDTSIEGASYRQQLTRARRVVIKVGSGVLVDAQQCLDRPRIAALADGVADLCEQGLGVILVSSGAIAAGAPVLGLAGKTRTIPQNQACAAVGQFQLLAEYERCFSQRGHHAAQLLLTAADVRNRQRYRNAKNTLEALLKAGVVPIVNENDTVAVEEIQFGDNDHLSAQVSALARADLLLLLSTVDGLFAKGPGAPGVDDQRPLALVEAIDARHRESVRDDHVVPAGISSGGMQSKLAAIEKVGHYGIPAVLANGSRDGVIQRVLAGEAEGTLFLPARDRLSARKHWILHTLEPRGRLHLDAGAVRAIVERGRSLLPIGVCKVEGTFGAGDAVCLVGPDHRELARGTSSYGSAEVAAIASCRSEQIVERLGYTYGDEVIHRDDLVLLPGGAGKDD